jgi:hypothetical protein
MKMLQKETRTNIQGYRNALKKGKLICKEKKNNMKSRNYKKRFENNDSRQFYEDKCNVRGHFHKNPSLLQ